MKIFLIVFTFLILTTYIFGKLLSDLKILQLEEYNIGKLIKYNFKNHKVDFCVLILSIFLCGVYFIKNENLLNILLLIIELFYLGYYISLLIKSKKYNICPKFTKRINRFLIVFFISSTILYILSSVNNFMLLLLILLPIANNFMTITLNFLLIIFEVILSKFYAKGASKKLEKQKIIKIAITGSYGKTSVKNILTTILKEKYCVLSSPKSYNTINGFSITVRENNLSKYDVIIMEMGAKKKGDIKKLCKLFKPQYGILTAIEKQHIETFKSIENIIKAKKELQDNLCGDNSHMVFNCNNEYVKNLHDEYLDKKTSVGVCNDCIFGVTGRLRKVNNGGCEFDIYYKDKLFCNAKCELIGKHNVENILLAVAMAIKLGLSKEQISGGISKLKPTESRMQPIEISNNSVVVNNGYNSNPASAKASLELIRLYDKRKVVIVCGFVEMGKEQCNLNRELGEQISQVADVVYVVNRVNREAILKGLQDGAYQNEIVIVDKFKNIDFNLFKDSVILIENDLPDNYV